MSRITRPQLGWLSAIAILATLGLCPTMALAQVAEVPSPDSQGNYRTALVLGNRGYYRNLQWLVVDPTGLNCRTAPNGAVRSRILAGAVVTAEFGSGSATIVSNNQSLPNTAIDAIAPTSGNPWLRLTGVGPLYFTPNNQGTLGTCYVRASNRYIAPINADSLPIPAN